MRRLPLLLLALATAAPAQVNTERLRRPLDRDGLYVTLDAAAALARGNTQYLQIGLGGRADLRLGDDLAFLVGRLDLAEADAARFVDRSFLHARYTRALGPRLSAEGFGQVERNRQQGLRQRYLAGAGLRADLLARDSLGLALGVTPMLEWETLAETLGGEQGAVVRVSSYLSARTTAPGGLTATAVTYLQPRADAPADLRLLSQADLEFPLTRSVRFRVRAHLRHDTRPPEGILRTDLALENGLVVSFPAR